MILTKNEKILIEKLKKAKIEKDKKWVFNLVAWALKNRDKNINTFHGRIGSAIHYAKGKYNNYWSDPKKLKNHDISQKKCIDKNKERYYKNQKEYNQERRKIHLLYREGKLSKKSIKIIEEEL